jgi:hypothetical protein
MTAAVLPPSPPPEPPRPPADGWRRNGPFTDPRDLSGRLEGLVARAGREPRALAEAVRGWMVHAFWRGAYGLPEEPARVAAETNLRDLRSKLARIGELQAGLGRSADDLSPLPPPQKLVGNCRDHSVFYAALLRAAGVPARARCGFARYFEQGKWIDHWVVERWESGRWVVGDAQIDALMQERLRLRFDPMDLPDGEFVSGGDAWLACRAGADPGRYGILHFWGWDFVKGNLVKDVAALGGHELLPWDLWGVGVRAQAELEPQALAELDALARATPMRAPLSAVDAAALAARPAVRLPRVIQSWPGPEPVDVDLGSILDG